MVVAPGGSLHASETGPAFSKWRRRFVQDAGLECRSVLVDGDAAAGASAFQTAVFSAATWTTAADILEADARRARTAQDRAGACLALIAVVYWVLHGLAFGVPSLARTWWVPVAQMALLGWAVAQGFRLADVRRHHLNKRDAACVARDWVRVWTTVRNRDAVSGGGGGGGGGRSRKGRRKPALFTDVEVQMLQVVSNWCYMELGFDEM